MKLHRIVYKQNIVGSSYHMISVVKAANSGFGEVGADMVGLSDILIS